MESYRPGDVVLLLFPFTDAEGARRRPSLLLVDTGDEDIVVARITSQAPRDAHDLRIEKWQSAGLLLPSVVRVHKLATLERGLVHTGLGRLDEEDWGRVQSRIRELWNIE